MLVAALALIAIAVPAGSQSWEQRGPEGGAVGTLAVDPGDPAVIYAAPGRVGVFKSVDGGRSWMAANRGIEDEDISLVAVDPASSATLYAAGRSFYRSTDAGVTWTVVGLSWRPRSLVVHPATSAVLASDDERLRKSRNGAADFRTVEVFDDQINALAVDPEAPNTVYAAISGGAIYRSLDFGDSWSPYGSGIARSAALELHFDPGDPEVVLARTISAFGTGVERSVDRGATWDLVPNFGSGLGNVTDLRFDRTGRAYILNTTDGQGEIEARRSFFASDDQGASWRELPGRLPLETPLTGFAMTADGGFVVASWCGVRRGHPRDGGYKPSNRGLLGNWMEAVVTDPRKPRLLYAATQTCGAFKSKNAGGKWRRLRQSSAPPGQTRGLAIDPGDPKGLYLWTSQGLFRSSNRGRAWTRLDYAAERSFLMTRSLAIDPAQPNRVYAANTERLYFSRDAGLTWSRARIPSKSSRIRVIVVDPLDSSTVYFVDGDRRLFRSDNAGRTWKRRQTGPRGSSVLAVAADPTLSGALWVTGSGGLFRSTDRGGSWRRIDLGSAEVGATAVLLDPEDPRIVYAGTAGDGVFRSVDDGATWERLGGALPYVRGLELAPSKLVAWSASGLFELDLRSVD